MRNEPSAPAAPPKARSWGVLVNSLIVMAGYVLSRILGLVRDVALTAYFGTSPTADAYRAAFGLPDLLYLVIIGGALGSAFIPVFSELQSQQGQERAWRLTNQVMTLALGLLALASAVVWLAAPALIGTFYAAFAPEQQALTVYLTRIFLLSPLLLGLGGLAMAVLNAQDRFTLPALAPALYNLSILFGIVVLAPLFARRGLYAEGAGVYTYAERAVSIEGVAWGVVGGALLYLLVQVPGLWRLGFRPRLRWGWGDAAVRKVALLMGPRVFGQAAIQINLIVMGSLASTLGAGRVTAINQAYQLMLLPHGIFVMSLATVMFPRMARLFSAGDQPALRETAVSTLRNVLWATIPAAVGLAVLSTPLVRLFFQRGPFDNLSTELVSSALLVYALALPFFAASEILIRAFYAMQRTWAPVLVGILAMVINVGAGALALRLGGDQRALVGAFALANIIEALVLVVLLSRHLGGLDPDGRLRRSLGRSALGALVMGGALAGLAALLTSRYPFLAAADPAYSLADLPLLLVLVLLLVAVGAGVYVGMAIVLKAEEWLPWRDRIRAKLGRRQP